MRKLLFHGLAWSMVTAAVASALWVAGQAGAGGLDTDARAGAAKPPVAPSGWGGSEGDPRRPVNAQDRSTVGGATLPAAGADEARKLLRR